MAEPARAQGPEPDRGLVKVTARARGQAPVQERAEAPTGVDRQEAAQAPGVLTLAVAPVAALRAAARSLRDSFRFLQGFPRNLPAQRPP